MIEYRTFRNVEIRAVGDGPNGRPVITVKAITPGVVDDYGSVWMPDTFDADTQARVAADPDDTPSLAWAHRWHDPIGHGLTYEPSDAGPALSFELDDFDAVPRAKQADAQVRSKTIRDCSVGFSDCERRTPTPEDETRWPGCTEVITAARLDEVSLVLRGAVPGAKVLAVRTAGSSVEVDEGAVLALAKKVQDGEITKEAAHVALDLLAGEPKPDPDPDPETGWDDTGIEDDLAIMDGGLG